MQLKTLLFLQTCVYLPVNGSSKKTSSKVLERSHTTSEDALLQKLNTTVRD